MLQQSRGKYCPPRKLTLGQHGSCVLKRNGSLFDVRGIIHLCFQRSTELRYDFNKNHIIARGPQSDSVQEKNGNTGTGKDVTQESIEPQNQETMTQKRKTTVHNKRAEHLDRKMTSRKKQAEP